jgi:integrase
MASIQKKGESWYCQFLHHGKRHTFTIGAVEQDEAEAKAGQVDLLLLRLSQRLAVIPPGMTIVEYLKFDGRPLAPETPEIKDVKLWALKDQYLAANKASLERNTLDCARTHFRHLEKTLGAGFAIASLTLADLQSYVDKRSIAKGKNGRTLSATTIQKEIHTLRAAWRWGAKNGLVAGPFRNDGLRYPRTSELPVFMTRKEIERHIRAGGLTAAELADLWHSLYLTMDEVTAFLKHIKEKSLQPFLYPAICFVAHTGARRSEMLRARVTDVDFEGRMVSLMNIPPIAFPWSMLKLRVRRKLTRTIPCCSTIFRKSTVVFASFVNKLETTGVKNERSRPIVDPSISRRRSSDSASTSSRSLKMCCGINPATFVINSTCLGCRLSRKMCASQRGR